MFKNLLFIVLACTCITASAEQLTQEQQSIKSLISNTYDRANSKVESSPIVTAGDYAIADWIQADKGGRALLKKTNGKWEISMCGGQGLTVAQNLIDAGIPKALAHRLANRLKAAESKLGQQKIKLFDSFGKIISFKEMHDAENTNKDHKTEKHPHHP